ncbi:hypothetical protein [Aeromonas sp. R5-2]|uniref:hypothetical protein n=1 Tax=Aeromonas sp. R5-2 TaxID=3138468 RepID=UPI0034A28232
MIDKLKDINDIVTSRFNNIIIGSFLTSFVMMNSRGLAIFIFSDNATRVSILKGWEIDYIKDLLIPLLLIAFYIIVIPIISILVKKHITNRIYKEEQDVERSRLLISLTGMQDVAIATAKSTTAYAEKYVDNQIKQWIDEREEKTTALDAARKKNNSLEEENKELTASESSFKSSSDYYSMLYDRSIGSINNIGIVIGDINHTSPASRHIKETFGSNSIEWYHYLTQQIIGAIKYAIEVNNNPPTTTHGDWTKPISATFAKELSALATTIEKDKLKRDDEQRQKEALMNEIAAAKEPSLKQRIMQDIMGAADSAANQNPDKKAMQDIINATIGAANPNFDQEATQALIRATGGLDMDSIRNNNDK